jgi:hypothetical protein
MENFMRRETGAVDWNFRAAFAPVVRERNKNQATRIFNVSRRTVMRDT